MSTTAMPVAESDVLADVQTDPALPWVTIVFNDPVNLMSYVTYVFRSYFGYSREKAAELMRQVHYEGKAIVSQGSREEMEKDTAAMHGFGLWASFRQMDSGGAA